MVLLCFSMTVRGKRQVVNEAVQLSAQVLLDRELVPCDKILSQAGADLEGLTSC